MKQVSFSYPGSSLEVVSNFSLELAANGSAALVGPSGSGKSTILALAGGLLLPDSGEVRIDDVSLLSGHRNLTSSQVSWVLQNLRSLTGRTALDNVVVALLAQGQRRCEAEVIARQGLAELGLAGFSDRKVEELSGGQLQRVCVARAIASRPRMILADEPTGQLDRQASLTVMEAFLSAAAKHGVALVIATHDQAIASMCDLTVQI